MPARRRVTPKERSLLRHAQQTVRRVLSLHRRAHHSHYKKLGLPYIQGLNYRNVAKLSVHDVARIQKALQLPKKKRIRLNRSEYVIVPFVKIRNRLIGTNRNQVVLGNLFGYAVVFVNHGLLVPEIM